MEDFPYLTQEEFTAASKHLSKLLSYCKNLDHKVWSFEDGTTSYVAINLEKPNQVSGVKTTVARDEWEAELSLEEHEDDPECIIRKNIPTKITTVEYHIVLSPVYRVPVLYFSMTIDSTPVSVQDIYESLVQQGGVLEDDMWGKVLRSVGITGAISQGDHPVLGTPFWFIHPCETAAWMANWGEVSQEMVSVRQPEGLFSQKGIISLQNYLQIWIGMVGGTVGLYLPAEGCHKSAIWMR